MIVFGTRGKVVPGASLQGVVCANCGKDEHVTSGVLRYFHVFWIPTFPTLRQARLECTHCKRVRTGDEIPQPTRREIAESIFTRGRVLPMFSGLVLIAALVGGGLYLQARDARLTETYLAAPAVGDLYVVKMARFADRTDPKYPYGLLRVKRILGDRLELEVGQEGYTRASGARSAIHANKHREADYFSSGTLSLSMSELLPLKKAGHIERVDRP